MSVSDERIICDTHERRARDPFHVYVMWFEIKIGVRWAERARTRTQVQCGTAIGISCHQTIHSNRTTLAANYIIFTISQCVKCSNVFQRPSYLFEVSPCLDVHGMVGDRSIPCCDRLHCIWRSEWVLCAVIGKANAIRQMRREPRQ